MKRIVVFIIAFLCSFSLFSRDTQYDTIRICSGSQFELKIKEYFEGSLFSWYEYINGKYESIPNSGSSYNSIYETNVLEEKKYMAIANYNNEVIDTTIFSVIINPNPVATIHIDKTCENDFTTLDYSSLNNIKTQIWEISGDKSLVKTPVYFNNNPGEVNVKLTIVDENSCLSEIDTSYYVISNPEIELSKGRLIDENFYQESINCGNDSSIYFVRSLGDSELLQWLVTTYEDNGIILNATSNEVISKNTDYISKIQVVDSMLTLRWQDSFDEPIKINVTAIVKTPDDCIVETSIENLITRNNTPSPGNIYQKSDNSALLLYKPDNLDEDPALNYQWGYILEDEDFYEGTNRKYCDFGELDDGKKYWVETYYSTSRECRTRNYFILQNKSVTLTPFSIFPNPADDYIEIYGEGLLHGSISLTNLDGVRLLQRNVNDIKKIRFNISGYNPGKYLIIYLDETGNVFSNKIVIQ